MSWQTYVDSNLVGTGHIKQGAIVGHNTAVWATSPGFNVSAAESTALLGAFTDPAGLISSGIHANGVKYMYLRSDDRSIYGKKGSDGIVIVKTNQTILIGVYGAPATPGNATVVVEKLADYLISVGY